MKQCDCGNWFTPKSRGYGAQICSSCVTNRRRFEVKKKAVEYLGGKCVVCGYDKCIEALEFDHKDPTEKEFAISGNHCLSWSTIKDELDKCELKCANCHRERHFNDKKVIVNKYPEIESHIITSVCEVCSTTFTHIKSTIRKFCSVACYGSSNVKIEWPSVEVLTSLVQSSSFEYVSSLLGVSSNAIRKHLIKSGINPKSIRSIKNNGYMHP